MIPILIAHADSAIPAPIQGLPGVMDAMCLIAAYFLWITIVITVIMIIMAAFDFATSGGETEKVTRGRKRIMYAAIGIIIALIAVSFPVIVGTAVGYQSPSGGGLTPQCAIFGGTGGPGGSVSSS